MSTELIAAVRKLVKAKGRYHTEQNYKAVVSALDALDATPAPVPLDAEGLPPAQSIGDDPKFQELAGEVYNAGFYNDSIEKPLNDLIAHIDGRIKASQDASPAGVAPLDPVEGDLLPPIGAKVLIHLGRQDAWVEHAVTGYYVWGALSHQVREGEKHAHRVFVRVKDANGYDNARLLSEVRIAAAPSHSPAEEDK